MSLNRIKILLIRYRRVLTILLNIAIFSVGLAGAFLLRFEFAIPPDKIDLLRQGLILAVSVKVLAFYLLRVDRGSLRHAGVNDMQRLVVANLLGSGLFTAGAWALIGSSFPRSVYVIDLLLCAAATVSARFAFRLYRETVVQSMARSGGRKILVYGAGAAGLRLLHDIRYSPDCGYRVIGFLDDDPEKWGVLAGGVPVLGGGRDAGSIVEKRRKRSSGQIDEIVIAMPSATGMQMQEALANCRAARLPCRTIPGVRDLLHNQVLTNQIRNVSVTDLLGRQPVSIEDSRVRARLTRRCVLVTGAAGSIGSEICRQVASFQPSKLIAFEQSESELFKVCSDLKSNFPGLQVEGIIGDIRRRESVASALSDHSVDFVFHAAAYKHVPLMEMQPLEAVANNVLGTYNVMQESRRHGVSTMLMISSDKAVNPTSVMGATKRICELMLSAMPSSQTKFVSVRFGNVLGSNGSVIPTFNAQVAAGGPVTVTHPEMRRYFMTIPEAVQLVLLASTMGSGSEIFVLDMGEPIKILDLARSIIRLNGREPGKDIEIRFTGMRPGEKLYEEVSTGYESCLPTEHRKIRIFQGLRLSMEDVADWPREFERVLERRDPREVINLLKRLVPEYEPDSSWGLATGEEPLAGAAYAAKPNGGAGKATPAEGQLLSHRQSLGLTG